MALQNDHIFLDVNRTKFAFLGIDSFHSQLSNELRTISIFLPLPAAFADKKCRPDPKPSKFKDILPIFGTIVSNRRHRGRY